MEMNDLIIERKIAPTDKDFTPISINENGHKVYYWSHNLKERVLQFWYQLNRCNDNQLKTLRTILDGLIIESRNKINSMFVTDQIEGKEAIIMIYKIIGQTRDIYGGKGERDLAYMMVRVWYDYFPDAAIYAVELFVKESSGEKRQYGSWRDIKYFCNYCKNDGLKETHPLIIAALLMLNKQLAKDIQLLDSGSGNKDDISYAAKWVPREKSAKFGWQFDILAECFFAEYFKSASSSSDYKNATTKAKMNYRKMVSKINRFLETPQITMCNDLWDNLFLRNLTSRTILNNQNALLNVNKRGEERYFAQDRVECALQFGDYIDTLDMKNGRIKGRQIELYEFVKLAYSLIENKIIDTRIYEKKINLLNFMWRDYIENIGPIKDSIAFIDFSIDIDETALFNAIGLACIIAQKSSFGMGVIIYSGNSKWVNLEFDGSISFVWMINQIKMASEEGFYRTSSNIYNAFDAILFAIRKNEHTDSDINNDISKINFIILSNMNFERDKTIMNDFFGENIKNKFSVKGLKQPYIILWNLGSSNEFQILGTTEKMNLFSGFRPNCLKIIDIECGRKSSVVTPWESFVNIMDVKRYDSMEYFMRHIINYQWK